jgi:hypothetical protein
MSTSIWPNSVSQPRAYVERRSAVQWPLVLITLSCWAVFVASVVLITIVDVDFIALTVISLLCSMFYAIVLFGRAMPVGIQINASGVHIGGISDAQRCTSPSDAKRTELPHPGASTAKSSPTRGAQYNESRWSPTAPSYVSSPSLAASGGTPRSCILECSRFPSCVRRSLSP